MRYWFAFIEEFDPRGGRKQPPMRPEVHGPVSWQTQPPSAQVRILELHP
jgi:hypothetical protein